MTQPKQPPFDPTYELVRRPKLPLTPEQLATYKPKPVDAAHSHGSAAAIAYRAGVKELEGIVLRLEAVEAELRRLKNL
jgi:hypothetical protein